MSPDPLFGVRPTFNTRSPPELAKELLFGWRGPVKDFTGMDSLDVERDIWMRASTADGRVRVCIVIALAYLSGLVGPRPWLKRTAQRIARR